MPILRVVAIKALICLYLCISLLNEIRFYIVGVMYVDCSCLIKTIFLSEKRKNILILLFKKGAKNIDDIKKELEVNSSALMPQMKKLLKWDLVTYNPEEELYSLSDVGVLIVEKLDKLLDIINIYVENLDYWKTRDLSEIPYHMRDRIGNLEHCKLLEADREYLFDYHPVIVDNIMASRYLMMISSTFQSQTIPLFSNLLEKNLKLNYVVTENIFNKLIEEFPEEMEAFLVHENVNISLHDGHIGPIALMVTDRFMALWLFDKKGRFDGTILLSYEANAIKWGKELFSYYSSISNLAYRDPLSGKLEITGFNITKAKTI